MDLSVTLNSFSDYRQSLLHKEDPQEQLKSVLDHKSQYARGWQIVAATILTVAFAAFAVLAAFAFVAVAQAVATGVSIFALPILLPLAIGTIATISTIAAGVFSAFKGLNAYNNRLVRLPTFKFDPPPAKQEKTDTGADELVNLWTINAPTSIKNGDPIPFSGPPINNIVAENSIFNLPGKSIYLVKFGFRAQPLAKQPDGSAKYRKIELFADKTSVKQIIIKNETLNMTHAKVLLSNVSERNVPVVLKNSSQEDIHLIEKPEAGNDSDKCNFGAYISIEKIGEIEIKWLRDISGLNLEKITNKMV